MEVCEYQASIVLVTRGSITDIFPTTADINALILEACPAIVTPVEYSISRVPVSAKT